MIQSLRRLSANFREDDERFRLSLRKHSAASSDVSPSMLFLAGFCSLADKHSRFELVDERVARRMRPGAAPSQPPTTNHQQGQTATSFLYRCCFRSLALDVAVYYPDDERRVVHSWIESSVAASRSHFSITSNGGAAVLNDTRTDRQPDRSIDRSSDSGVRIIRERNSDGLS